MLEDRSNEPHDPELAVPALCFAVAFAVWVLDGLGVFRAVGL